MKGRFIEKLPLGWFTGPKDQERPEKSPWGKRRWGEGRERAYAQREKEMGGEGKPKHLDYIGKNF